MSQLYVNYPSYWNPHEQRISDSSLKDLSLKVNSSYQMCDKVRNLGFQIQEDLSTSQSTQSNHDVKGGSGNNSQDQCNSSESGQEVSCGMSVEGQLKPVLVMGSQDAAYNPPQVDYSHTVACVPYPYVDPYFKGALAAAYQPTAIIQPQMVGVSPARVPLPLAIMGNVTEDEPIYVNAKQYHGILRRRQSRAKLEAQNKLVKVRKPYLHESRHLHAMNRVRGSGGRFLSVKKLQQQLQQHNPPSSASPTLATDLGTGAHSNSSHIPTITFPRNGNVTAGSSAVSPGFGFTDLSSGRQFSGFIKSPTEQHYAHIVR